MVWARALPGWLCSGAFGCGGGGSSPSTPIPIASPIVSRGTLNVTLVDTPATPTISRIDLTVDRVEADVNGQWQPISSTAQTVNLLDLATVEGKLGSQLLPQGGYSRIRVIPTSFVVTDTTGAHPVSLAGIGTTGIEIPINFTIQANGITDVILDFNAARSLQRQADGSYILTPVIAAYVRSQIGSIGGSVISQSGTPLPGAQITAVYGSGNSYPHRNRGHCGGGAIADGRVSALGIAAGVLHLEGIVHRYRDRQYGSNVRTERSGLLRAGHAHQSYQNIWLSVVSGRIFIVK